MNDYPVKIASDDFNGDDKMDLAVIDYLSDDAGVLINTTPKPVRGISFFNMEAIN